MRFVFVMDAIGRVDPEKDSTFGFLQSAAARSHTCLHSLIDQVEYVDGEITALVRPLGVSPKALCFEGPAERVCLSDVDAVFIRKDPPFDDAYAYATLLLEQLRGRTVMVNDPRGLREANEKLYALNFAKHCPPMLVTSDRDRIHQFVDDEGGKAVIKPLDGAGGFGVMALAAGDSNARAIVDMLTLEGKQLAIVQGFIPAVVQGDKRVILLDGELLGAILRIPREGDLRANIHVGGSVVPTELNSAELAIVEDIAPRLRADGLTFVGLDLIGEQLTEVNVTSPTGIRELSSFRGERMSDRVIAWVEARAALTGV
jgi:glutathione synthase